MDTPHFLNCDQEAIHLCGHVQNFGCLIVFNKFHHCIGWSENWQEISLPKHSIYRGLLLSTFINNLNLSHSIDLDQILRDNIEIFKHRYVADIQLQDETHHLSIYPFGDKIFIEIEKHRSRSHQFQNIYHYAQHINNNKDIWKALAALQMTAQMIRDRAGLSQEFLAKAGKNMMEAISLMNNMLDKTVDFARTKSYDSEYEPVYRERFIQHIIDDCKVRYHIDKLEFQKGRILPIDGEKTLIYLLFLNLLGNAIKYSSNKGIPIIGLDSEDCGHAIVYKIYDNGIGISAEETERIFEISHRLRNAVEFDGSGVGLSIAKRILERLNAIITVESTLNEGTAFTNHFPKKILR